MQVVCRVVEQVSLHFSVSFYRSLCLWSAKIVIRLGDVYVNCLGSRIRSLLAIIEGEELILGFETIFLFLFKLFLLLHIVIFDTL